jgi:hypothetical protein
MSISNNVNICLGCDEQENKSKLQTICKRHFRDYCALQTYLLSMTKETTLKLYHQIFYINILVLINCIPSDDIISE